MKELIQLIRDVIDEFADVLREAIKPRTIFALMFYATFCWLVLQEKPVPESLNNIVFSLISFWFGTKVGEKWGDVEKPKDEKEKPNAQSIP